MPSARNTELRHRSRGNSRHPNRAVIGTCHRAPRSAPSPHPRATPGLRQRTALDHRPVERHHPPAHPTISKHKRPVTEVTGAFHVVLQRTPEPQKGIEPLTARLRIECSTTELLWQFPTEVPTLTCPDADSNRDALRHHPLKMACLPISPPGRPISLRSHPATCNLQNFQRGRRGSNPRPPQ